MYAHYMPASSRLTEDDTAGICAIDPPDGTRVTSRGAVVAAACDPTPSNGFSTACSGFNGDGGSANPMTMHCPSTGGCAIVRVRSSANSDSCAMAILGVAAVAGATRKRLRRTGRPTLGPTGASVSESVFFQFFVQRRHGDSEPPRRVHLVAVGLSESLPNGCSLDPFERLSGQGQSIDP
jgi:hypothetical protein